MGVTRDEDTETWAEAHGYQRITCGRCGWSGMTDTAQCDRCPSPCDECGEERSEDTCCGDWCEDCASCCESCGEAVLDKDLRDGWCPACDDTAETCPACGEREDRGCAATCAAGEEVSE